MKDKELMKIVEKYPYSVLDVKNLHAVVGDKVEPILDIIIQLDRYNGRGGNIQTMTNLLGQLTQESKDLRNRRL